ncbi:MAG TPA: signal peptidase I [Gemmatimonadaceae bacterium]|jgi:signal peptidase I
MAKQSSSSASNSPSRKPASQPGGDKRNVVAQARGGGGKPSRPAGQVFWENFKSILGAVVIYLFIKTLFVEAFRIPSGSMIPTLLVGDWLFVNKLAYGPTIPFTNSHLPGYTNPKHGDVVVFVSPYQADNAPDFTPTLVKRLIGMPGDTLLMRAGVLSLNGVPQRQSFAASNPSGDNNSIPQDHFAWQHTIEAKNTRFGPPPDQPTLGNWGPLVIPADRYFMMGDNRYCSKDSRYWGVVPRANMRGRPLFVYYSYVPGPDDQSDPCSGQVSDRPIPFITDIRWSRIGHWVK